MAHTEPQPLRAASAGLPEGTPRWITPDLLEQTQLLWGKKSGIAISIQEALAIILRVGALFDVLSRRYKNE